MEHKFTNESSIEKIINSKVELIEYLEKLITAVGGINTDNLTGISTDITSVPGVRSFVREIDLIEDKIDAAKKVAGNIIGHAIYMLPIK